MNTIISEDVLYLNILKDTKNILNMVDKKDEKKNFLKVYGNAFALLLLQGYKCTSVLEDGVSSYMLEINDEPFVCDEETLKSILFKDFDVVMEECLV